jgi:hypothetical protein
MSARITRVGVQRIKKLIMRSTSLPNSIGDQIVSVLERRLAAMRAELEKLGAEGHGQD